LIHAICSIRDAQPPSTEANPAVDWHRDWRQAPFQWEFRGKLGSRSETHVSAQPTPVTTTERPSPVKSFSFSFSFLVLISL
jgi:hypothetical protein